MEEWRVRCQRGFHIHDRIQRLVLHVDRLEGVRRMLGVRGENNRDAVAHLTHLAFGEGREVRHDDVIGDRPHAGNGTIQVTKFVCAVRGHDIGLLESTRDVEFGDVRVSERAAQDRHVQRPRQLDVVGPVGPTVEEFGVLLALDGSTKRRRGLDGFGHFAPPMSSAGFLTERTMLW